MKSAVRLCFNRGVILLPYTKASDSWYNADYESSNEFGTPPTPSYTRNRLKVSKTKTGEYLPHWKQLVRDGSDATTSFDGVIQKMEAEEGGVRVTFWHPLGQPRQFQKTKFTEVTGKYSAVAPPTYSTGADVTLANNQALSRLLRDVKANTTHFSGGVFLGELRETIKLIKRPASALRNGLGEYFSTLRKRMGRAPKHRIQGILADTWLEYSFGWSPLINDIKGAAETLARFENDSRRASARGYGINERLESSPTSSQLVNNYVYFKQIDREVSNVKVIYRVGLKFEASAPFGSARRLAELSGFTFNEFVPTVWELIPWSFVVDYFFNVGEILEAVTTDTTAVTYKCKSIVYSVVKTQKTIADNQRILSVIGPKDLISITGSSLGNSQSSRSTVTRRLQSSLGIPAPVFTFPPLESAKWINLAALMETSRSLTKFLQK